MLRLRSLVCAVLLTLSSLAAAETILVQTGSHGDSAMANRTLLSALGIDPGDDADRSFDLNVIADYDRDSVTYSADGGQVYAEDTTVNLVFRFGERQFSYLGTGYATATVFSMVNNSDTYKQTIELAPESTADGTHSIKFEQWVSGGAGTFANIDPLATVFFASDNGQAAITLIPVDPNGYYYGMNAPSGTFDVMAVSPVSEPTSAALVVGGLLVIAWKARRRSRESDSFGQA